ncbi:MAG TPA: SdrD B-like domain-containing protein [Allosphingosinicella sp.]|nr:SdrD B-like domain-containing protein [Allosphingosinicella sp.]
MSAPRLVLGLLGCLGTLALVCAAAAAQRGPRLSNGRSIIMDPQGAPPAGRICVAAFDDRDGDGVRDAGEPPLAGRRFVILGDANVTLAQGSTDAAGDYCSTGLPPGAYSLREAGPGAGAGRTVTITGAETARIAFGAR